MEYHVTHFPERQRFEIVTDGYTAFLEYELEDDSLDIVHTLVPPALEGRGIGSALMKQALLYARENQLRVIPTCRFADVYMRRHE